MAPGPLVPPSLNGQKRDSKRGKPRRQPPAMPAPLIGLHSTLSFRMYTQGRCRPRLSPRQDGGAGQGFLGLMLPDPWASSSLPLSSFNLPRQH